MKLRLGFAVWLVAGLGVVAFPQVPENPVAEPVFTAESIAPSLGTLPYPLMPGMFVTIYGRALGPASSCIGRADSTRLETPSPERPNQNIFERTIYPTSLCSVQVLVGDEAAGLLYVSESQINFKVPQSTSMEGTAEPRVVRVGE